MVMGVHWGFSRRSRNRERGCQCTDATSSGWGFNGGVEGDNWMYTVHCRCRFYVDVVWMCCMVIDIVG